MASHSYKVLRSDCGTHRRNSSKRDVRGGRDTSHSMKLSHLKRSASDNDGSLNMPLERSWDMQQSASVKSANLDLITMKASAPPMNCRTGNVEVCKTVSQHSSTKNNVAEAKERTRSEASEPTVGGRMLKRCRTFMDLFGVPLNSRYITWAW